MTRERHPEPSTSFVSNVDFHGVARCLSARWALPFPNGHDLVGARLTDIAVATRDEGVRPGFHQADGADFFFFFAIWRLWDRFMNRALDYPSLLVGEALPGTRDDLHGLIPCALAYLVSIDHSDA